MQMEGLRQPMPWARATALAPALSLARTSTARQGSDEARVLASATAAADAVAALFGMGWEDLVAAAGAAEGRVRRSEAYKKRLDAAKKFKAKRAGSGAGAPMDTLSAAGQIEGWVLTYEERISMARGDDRRQIVSPAAAAAGGEQKVPTPPVLLTLRSDLLLDVTEAVFDAAAAD